MMIKVFYLNTLTMLPDYDILCSIFKEVLRMLSKKNPFNERLISFYMTLFAILLIWVCIKEKMPKDFKGIIEFIYNSVI